MIFACDNQASMAKIYGSKLASGGTVKDKDIEKWLKCSCAITAD